jgi:hypothetical protein
MVRKRVSLFKKLKQLNAYRKVNNSLTNKFLFKLKKYNFYRNITRTQPIIFTVFNRVSPLLLFSRNMTTPLVNCLHLLSTSQSNSNWGSSLSFLQLNTLSYRTAISEYLNLTYEPLRANKHGNIFNLPGLKIKSSTGSLERLTSQQFIYDALPKPKNLGLVTGPYNHQISTYTNTPSSWFTDALL